jgi:hypothetical protein
MLTGVGFSDLFHTLLCEKAIADQYEKNDCLCLTAKY